MISDGKKIYLTGASTIRAFEPKPPGHGKKGQAKDKKGTRRGRDSGHG